MIEAKELRIGNLVTHDGKVQKVTSIEENEVRFFNEQDQCRWTVTVNKIEPIELTPEILGKLKNCEKIYDGSYSTKWDIAFRDLRYICVTYAKPDNTWSVTLSSTIVMKQPTLHWLQNIIYYNWGKDLEITL